MLLWKSVSMTRSCLGSRWGTFTRAAVRRTACCPCRTGFSIAGTMADSLLWEILHTRYVDNPPSQRAVRHTDFASKMVPITGQGCNMAIQDAAALVNSIASRVKKYGGKIPKAEIEAAFRETEKARHDHVEYSRTDAYDMQEQQAMQSKIFLSLFPLVAKTLSLDSKHEVNRAIMFNTAKLDHLPLPYRPHFIPFADELAAKNIASGLWDTAGVAASIGLWIATKMMCASDEKPTSFVKNIFRHFTGIGQPVSSQVGSSDTLYTTTLLAAMAINWTVERYRRSNRQAMMGPLMS